MRAIKLVSVLAVISLIVFARVGRSQDAIRTVPKLVVLLEPVGPPEFVPLKGGKAPYRERPAYNFILMAVNDHHPPERPLATETVLVRLGETLSITSSKGQGKIQVRGTVTLSAPAKARYEAELLIAGSVAASAAAFVNFGSVK